jgi:hypothetical protein
MKFILLNSSRLLTITFTLVLMTLAQLAHAVTKTWVGGASGSWNTVNQWSPSGVPGASDDVVFGAGTAVVSFSGDGVIQSLTLNNGADVTFFPVDASADRGLNLTGATTTELVVNSGCTLTLDGFAGSTVGFTLEFPNGGAAETADISGTLSVDGAGSGGDFATNGNTVTFGPASAYNHNRSAGSIPIATFNTTSTVTVTGFIDNVAGAIENLDQGFGNFTWNCPSQIGHAQLKCNTNKSRFSSSGTFTVNNTGTKTLRTTNGDGLLSLNDLVINGDPDSSSLVLRSNTTKTITMDVSGNITLNGGELKSKNPSATNTSTVVINLAGNLTQDGGILKEEDGNSFTFNFVGTSVQEYGFTGLSVLGGDINFDVKNGAELKVLNKLTVNSGGSINNSGKLIFDNDAIFDAAGAITGTGNVTLVRVFNRSGWQNVSFPVKSTTTKTLGDVVKSGEAFNYTSPKTPQTNIFYWDATTAGWLVPTSTTLVNQPFNIYSFGSGESVELTIPNAEFNNVDFSQAYFYFDNPGGNTSSPGDANPSFGNNGWADVVVDGWNLFANPFQAYLNTSDLNSALDIELNVDQNVYVWDGYSESYKTNPDFINPHQAYFVHTTASSGNFTIQNELRDTAGTGAGYFKTKNEITLHVTSADGIDVKTTLVENSEATNRFDTRLDAHYLLVYSTDNATAFNSVSADSMMCSKNQVNRLTKEPIYFTFAHKQNNKSFTFSLEASSSLYVAILEDTYTGEFTDLVATDYTFSSTDAADAQRFKMHFTQGSANRASAQYTRELMVWTKDNQLMYEGLDNLEGATVSVFAISGKLITSGDMDSPLFLERTGIFVIQVRARNGETFNAKLIKG